ncbi:MAG: tRNA pseudouridine32 synthase/23S rRNA pseudouridine746 synthase [Paraglaciecola sp.]|jgi:tRNA pseudouridine32 synthase/23S rRNA pseudouridine746 synthase
MDTLDIVFDHPDFIVVNKPPGISVQNEAQQRGILPIICSQLGLDKLWLVHRLDKVTSGLLILAKNAEAAAVFGAIFESRKIEKFYLALSAQKPKKKQGTIAGNMKKVRDGKWMLSKQTDSAAVSQFFSTSVLPGVRLFLIKPHTGKTHQIRVALKSLGSPILGDILYGGGGSQRTYLHAYALRFLFKGEPIELLCPPTIGELFTHEALSQRLPEYHQPWAWNWPQLPKGIVNQKVLTPGVP